MVIHSKVQLDDTENLVYLRDAMKNRPARYTMESLTQDIECLQKYYDQLCVINRVHPGAILDVPLLKNGSGNELRCFHDVAKQHLHTLNVTKYIYESFPSFITSVLGLKLD